MSGDLRDALTSMNALPDISHSDSARLQGLTRTTAVEIKALGGVGAATSLEMIGYIRELELGHSSRDAEIKQVLEGLATHQIGSRRPCWCPLGYESEPHSPACLAARALYEKVSK